MTEAPVHADIDPNRVFIRNCIKFAQHAAAQGDASAKEILHSYTLFSAVTEHEHLDRLIESQLVFRDEKEPRLTAFVEQVRRFKEVERWMRGEYDGMPDEMPAAAAE